MSYLALHLSQPPCERPTLSSGSQLFAEPCGRCAPCVAAAIANQPLTAHLPPAART